MHASVFMNVCVCLHMSVCEHVRVFVICTYVQGKRAACAFVRVFVCLLCDVCVCMCVV